MDQRPEAISIKAWSPPIRGVREVLHASFAHAYPLHTHDSWTLFIVDEGAIRYDLGRRDHGEDRTMVSVLPPHIVHDGRPASDAGYRKRVIYLEAEVLGEELVGPAVDRPQFPDRLLRRRVAALHDALACADDMLEAETRLAFLVERLRASLGAHPAPDAGSGDAGVPEALRAFLDAHLFESVTLNAAAEHVGGRPTQVARSFVTEFGIAPHAYVIGRRLEAARVRILQGQPLADVAAEVGFYDQAHLTRRFRRLYGITPGRLGAQPRALAARRPATTF